MKPEWRSIIERLTEEGVDRAVLLRILKDEKKHSDFSASGSERWLNCPGSVELSRKAPSSPDSYYSVDGTVGHYYLEKWLGAYIKTGNVRLVPKSLLPAKKIYRAVKAAVHTVIENYDRESEVLELEKRMSLEYLHEGVFGTGDLKKFDEFFGKLSVWDYKQGQQAVHTEEIKSGIRSLNTQLMFYALAAAKEIGLDSIDEIEIGVIQPNAPIKGKIFRTSTFDVKTLLSYETFFKKGIERALKPNARLYSGKWCHFCKAKEICPEQEKIETAKVAEYF